MWARHNERLDERTPLLHLRWPLIAFVLLCVFTGCSSGEPDRPLGADFERIERDSGSRVGVDAIDTATGKEVAYRSGERFAYASAHKAFSAAAVLRQNTVGGLNRRITYGRGDLVEHSPVTEKHVDSGMTLREVIDAAVHDSDNTAGNLLFREIGGPAGLNAMMRSLGDTTTHADRIETELNTTSPGDIRDTTTPHAFAQSFHAITVGEALPPEKRAVLDDVLRTNTSGGTLIRAAVPQGWQAGDKSGGATNHGIRNDIAVLWPPNRAPIVLTVLTDKPAEHAAYDDAVVARAAGAALAELR